jgi:hypothetical protein
MLNIFYKSPYQYTNRLDPLRSYLDQITKYINIQKQVDLEYARMLAKSVIKHYVKDKTTVYFERGENGDRKVKTGSLLNYII